MLSQDANNPTNNYATCIAFLPLLKDLFLLDPEVVYLNHGSFGACPEPVFHVYQALQRQLERQPVRFLVQEFAQRHREARRALAKYFNVDPDDLVYLPNATYGVNIIARSINLQPGDQILTSDQEYGACDKIWDFICSKTGADYIRQPISLPLSPPETLVECFFQAVTSRTRLIFISHITSSTAQRLPIEAICQRAKEAGILTLIDGAHAPGQIPVDIPAIGADFYTGNCHKWMLSPKGSAFLYARRNHQEIIEPLVVSWGYRANREFTTGSRYLDTLQWRGTVDPAAELAVPAAIAFMQEHNWDSVRQECNALLRQALARIEELTGLASLYPAQGTVNPHPLPPQMGIAELPPIPDGTAMQNRLRDQFQIEAPLTEWNRRVFIRLSIQAYNTQQDIDKLLAALQSILAL